MGAYIRPTCRPRLEIKEAFCQALDRKYNQTRKVSERKLCVEILNFSEI